MANFNTHRKRQVGSAKGKVTPEAINVLTKLPGITASTLSSWLFSARVLEDDDMTYMDICDYVQNGQQHGYGISVENIVRVVPNGVIDFEHDQKRKGRFRMMLWHGTKKSVIAGILQNGFKLPNSNGQMFGAGIYFADRISKSTNYCDQGPTPVAGSTAFLLLCDVLLGNIYNSKNAKNGITDAPPGHFDSVMCTGQYIPDRSGNRDIQHSILPCGPTITNTKFQNYTVQYNEYIVYHPKKIRIKYLVEVKFHSVPV